MGITKPCIQLHPAPSISTQFILTSTQLHTPPSNSFQPPSSSLQHPQQNSNKNIASNWENSLNLGQKFQIRPFLLKTDTHGILEVLIPNPGLVDFWYFNPKIHSWANLGPKRQSCLFCLKIGTHGISRMLILNTTLFFWFSKLKFIFGQIWAKNS